MKIIKNIIKKSDRLYVIARCIKNINDPNYWKLIKGYYEEFCDDVSILIEHRGEKYPDKIIYNINFCVPYRKRPGTKENAGFCALLRWTLLSLSFPDVLGMTPVVEWGRNSVYYDSGMDSVTTNVFEYFFEPVSMIYSNEVGNCKNVIEVSGMRGRANSFFFMKRASDMFASYCVEQEEIEKLAYLYKKYIHLNKKTKKYIENQTNGILDTGTILAVHVRGTDFNMGEKNHPVAVTAEKYLEAVKQLCTDGNYEKIFLATDDTNALELFKQEFKDKLLYYKDVFRTGNHIGAHTTFDERPFHQYKLGLEVLRDIYTLANCDSLICGLSQVSFAARYVNISLNRKYREIIILDHGINTADSAEIKKYRRKKEANEGT